MVLCTGVPGLAGLPAGRGGLAEGRTQIRHTVRLTSWARDNTAATT